MNQPSTWSARGMSKGVFLAMFLIPFVLTYVVGWLSPLIGLVGVATGDGGGWIASKLVHAVLYIWMAGASWARGAANGSKWAAALPLTAGVFDVFLAFVPFVPTVLNIVALVVGVQNGRAAAAR